MNELSGTAFATRQFDRRAFLRFGGSGVLAAGGAALLAACSSPSGGSSPSASATGGATSAAAAAYGTIALQLSWIKDIEFAGEYFATENGYYTSAGFTAVNLIANSGSTSAEDVVASGQALIGLSSPSATAPAIAKGAPLKTIATTYQKNPFCLLSLEERTPITTVAELKGKKVGVQSGANQTIWEGFLKANGLTLSDVDTVTTQFSIAPLEQGKYDAHFSYLTNEPIQAAADGYKPVTLGFADNGLPFVAETYIVTQDTLNTKKDLLEAFLAAEVKGWTDAVKDPHQSAVYAATKFGADQKLAVGEQTDEATDQNGLIVSAETNKNGLLTISDALVEQNIKALAAMGTTITASSLFDTSVIDQVFKDHPELIVTLPITKA